MKIDLSPEETGYLLGMLREHLDYYRTLASNGSCTDKNRKMHEFLETLVRKLNRPLAGAKFHVEQ